MQQVDVEDDAGWTDWRMMEPTAQAIGGGGVAVVGPSRLPLYVFVVEATRQIQFTVETGADLEPTWAPWTKLPGMVDASARLAVTSTPTRVWAAARTLDREVICWELSPGGGPVEHRLGSFVANSVSMGAFPGEDAVYVVARDVDGGLHGRRVVASP